MPVVRIGQSTDDRGAAVGIVLWQRPGTLPGGTTGGS